MSADTLTPREVQLRFPGPDRDLAGALTVPEGDGPLPAAVLVSGSGPLDRNSNAPRMPIDSTRQLAHALARAGIASLRYDKRGVGESRLLRDGTTEGRNGWKRAGLFDNADDTAAAFSALATRPEADPGRMFLVGHSEGALLVAHTAARLLAGQPGPRPAGVVLLAGSAQRGDAVLRWQAAVIAPTLPAPVRALLRLLRVDLVAKVSRNHDKVRATTTDVARMGGVAVNATWFREYLDHDPRPDLSRLDLPVLAITGSKDLQVDPADLPAIAAAVPGPVETWCAPDVSHLLRTQPGPPSVRAYKQEVRRPVEPAVLDRVTRWLTAQAAGDADPTAVDSPAR
ncbi:alpha/beta hydrolase family protein [Modestobacter marinus]|uniref:alpha/beta hydrolase family protein n=1 Tax=Modestobacter marinus TaxID=477641 RepID=UPI001C96F9B2|nr:alpha/beta fold hydrolase [Modestobacter marinus]